MPYSADLHAALHRNIEIADEFGHAHAGSVHLLLALLDDRDAVETLRACNVNLDTLRTQLVTCLREEPPAEDPAQTTAAGETASRVTGTLLRVIARAGVHVQVSGAEKMTGAHVLVAMFSERCRASQLLQGQDMTRADALEHVSRSTGKARL